MMRYLPTQLLIVVVCAASQPSWATPCLYLGTDADTRVINRSGEITTPYPTALAANDCARLRVATGNVKVYMVKDGVGGLNGVHVSRGQLVHEGTVPVGADMGGILKQIVLVLEGVNRTRTGSSRSAEVEYLISSLPNGKVSEPANDLVLELSPAADQSLEAFELFVDGKSVFRQTGPAKTLRLPHSAMKPGSTVRWKLDYSGRRHGGQFTVEAQSRIQGFLDSAQATKDVGKDSIAQALRVATVLVQEGYEWDAREMIRRALSGD